MELRHYLAILRRRWIPLIAVPVIVGLFVLTQIVGGDPTYTASAQLSVTRDPQQIDIEDFRYDEYYLFLSSEFMIDDLVEIVQGNVFAEDVHQRLLDEHGVNIPAGEIQEAIISERRHRILTLDVTNHEEERAVMIAQAATDQLTAGVADYFGFEDPNRSSQLQPVEFPERAEAGDVTNLIFWALQVLVGLFAGVLLAFFLDYMDDRMYSSESVEHALDLDVIAEIPRGKVL